MNQIQQIILEKVLEIKKTHKGGEKFFDKLDGEIIGDASLTMIKELFKCVPENFFIVLSGGFGNKVSSLIDNAELPKLPYYLFNGGIRLGSSPELKRFANFDNDNISSNGIFLDDSIYGGKTYRDIQEWFSSKNHKLVQCAVIYDGCPILKEDIKSLFRYYDFFKPDKISHDFNNN